MGCILENGVRIDINSVIDFLTIIVMCYNISNLSYLLRNKGNNPICFPFSRLFRIKIF